MIGADASPSTRAAVLEPPAVQTPDVRTSRIAAYYELTKPGITRMVLVTAAAGFYLASTVGLDVVRLLHTLLGTALASSGSLALNQLVERNVDGRMNRTAGRPLPAGRISVAAAAGFGFGLSVLGVAYLALFTNGLTAALVAASIVTYVAVYTPLKRWSWTATLVGAVPGALPILAGWTAARGMIDAGGLALFMILFLWQMPHFYALLWIYRDDYARAGFRLLTVGDPHGSRTVRHILFFTFALVAASLVPSMLGVTDLPYLAGALLLGAAFTSLAASFAWRRDERRAMRLFLGSVLYLPLLLLMMVVDRLV